MKNVGKGVKPKCVRHASLEHALENDGCGSEKLLKNKPSVVDDRSCCKELFLLLEENVCCRTLVRGRTAPVVFAQPRLVGKLLKELGGLRRGHVELCVDVSVSECSVENSPVKVRTKDKNGCGCMIAAVDHEIASD